MDEEKLHSQLNSRINEVFDNYDDTTANEGWALLRQKFPEQKKDRGLIWLWYAAAAVFLVGIGLWFIQPQATNQNMVAKAPKPTIHPNQTLNRPVIRDTLSNKTAGLIAKSDIPQEKLNSAGLASPGQQAQAIQKLKVQINHPAKAQHVVVHSPVNVPGKVAVTDPITKPDQLNNSNAVADVVVNKGQAKNDAVVKSADSLKNADNYAANKPVATEKATSAEAMNKLLAEKALSTNKDTKKAGKKTSISVYAATYFNYAKGSDNLVNVGAGFTSDFKLSNNLKLSTGLSIGQNSLNYNSGQPSRGGNLYAADPSPASAALSSVTASSGTLSSSTAFSSAAPVLNNYKASLIGLDIPINIKYQFNPQKNDTYISAGLSSGTFINETYTLNYTYARGDQQSTTRANFSGFDLAKTLNVSFGVGYPLGKTNRLIVEPFLKYPLDGLGLQQIKFGAGGINLKLNFQSSKK